MPKLARWRFVNDFGSPINYDESNHVHLQGNIINDNRFIIGELIRTSRVKQVADDFTWAKTKNTHYELGDRLPEGEFPKMALSLSELKELI